MLAGIAAAAWSLLHDPARELPAGAVARVGEQLILREDWERAIAAVASERRTPLTEDDRRHILDRLVDEELLVQHGLDLGLVERDRRLRGLLVGEVLASASGSGEAADLESLRRHYETHRERFATPERLRLRAWRIAPDEADAEARARTVAQELRGSAAAATSLRPFDPPVPDSLLPPGQLRDYLGPALTAAAQRLAAGESDAIRSEQGWVVLQVLEREPLRQPAFESITEAVRQDHRQQQDEAAVRALLDELLESQDVVVRP